VYVVAYGIALVLGGRLGDRFGRRRLLLGGMLAFTVSSALCAVSRARRSWCSPARCRVSLRPRCVPRCCRSSRSPCRRSGTSAIGAYGAGGTRAVERSVERRGGVALLPGALLAWPPVRIGLALTLAFYASNTGLFVVLTFFLQDGLHASPLVAGVTFAQAEHAYRQLVADWQGRTRRKRSRAWPPPTGRD